MVFSQYGGTISYNSSTGVTTRSNSSNDPNAFSGTVTSIGGGQATSTQTIVNNVVTSTSAGTSTSINPNLHIASVVTALENNAATAAAPPETAPIALTTMTDIALNQFGTYSPVVNGVMLPQSIAPSSSTHIVPTPSTAPAPTSTIPTYIAPNQFGGYSPVVNGVMQPMSVPAPTGAPTPVTTQDTIYSGLSSWILPLMIGVGAIVLLRK